MHRVYHVLYQCQTHTRAYVLGVALTLVERFERIGRRLFVHAFARVAHLHVQRVLDAPHRHVDFTELRRELQRVGYQIVQQLAHIVGHKVHRHLLLDIQLQVDVLAAGVVAIGVYEHRHIGGDAAVAPVQLALLRLELRDVEQLVDECLQTLALPLYGQRVALHLVLRVLLQFLTQSEYHGERRPELVGDAREEVFSHLRHPLQVHVVVVVHALCVEEYHQRTAEQQQYDDEYDAAHHPCRPLALQRHIRRVHHPCLLGAFDGESRVLYAVHLLHVYHAVLHRARLLVGCERRTVVARAFVVLII